MSQIEELKEQFNQIAPKLREAVKKAKEEATKTQDWVNIRIYQGQAMQAIISVSPNGVVMLRICTRNIRNCVRLTRPEHLLDIAQFMAVFGTSKAFEELKNILEENPGKATSTIDLSVF